MRKGRWYRQLAARGYSVPFAPDDPQRPDLPSVPHAPRLEPNLAAAQDLLQKGRTAEALQRLNDLAPQANSQTRLAQITAMVGDSDFKRGRFDDAITAYQSAAAHVDDDPRAWVRPAIAEVRALLKGAWVNDAYTKAQAVWQRSYDQHEDTERLIAFQEAHLQINGSVTIRLRPHRASVVASRLGNLFLHEGEIEYAREFFTNAITVNPQGGSRARQGLAIIALAEEDFALAESRAREALLLGKYQKKTIGVWQTLIAARQRASLTGLPGDLLAGVQSTIGSTVRARATFAIVRALRAHNDPAWESIAESWLNAEGQTHPTIATEIRKLQNSKTRLLNEDPQARLDSALQLYAAPELLSPTEAISVIKQYFQAYLELAGANNLIIPEDYAESFLKPSWGMYRYRFQQKITHTIALSCMMARRHDLARPLLQSIINANNGTGQWGRSVWALARMEAVLGNHADAAALYQQYADESAMPLRFRLQARVNWLRSFLATEPEQDPSETVRTNIAAATDQIDDFEILLEFARQLSVGPPGLRVLVDSLLVRSKNLALAEFAACEHPSRAIRILFQLTRRLVDDFGKSVEAITIWNDITQQKRDWLWSTKSEFWQYIAWVIKGLIRTNEESAADQLANAFLSDPSTPVTGKLEIMSSLAHERVRSVRFNEALATFALMTSLAPTSKVCAEAYYWLALKAKHDDDESKCVEYAEKLQAALGAQASLLSEWELDCKASLLRAGLVPGTAFQSANYSSEFQTKCLAQITADLNGF